LVKQLGATDVALLPGISVALPVRGSYSATRPGFRQPEDRIQARFEEPAAGLDHVTARPRGDQHGQPLPLPTYTLDTPSGGCHLYYAASAGRVRNSAGRLGPLIEIRGDGGYVIGAGSQLDERAYRARDERAPVPLPGGSLTNFRMSCLWRRPQGRSRFRRRTGNGICHGRAPRGNPAGRHRPAGNPQRHAQPGGVQPWPARGVGLLPPVAVVTSLSSAAERAGLHSGETRRTIRSGMTAGPHSPRDALPTT
jgi:hypothetical protein